MKILAATNLEAIRRKEGEILFAGDWVKGSLNFERNLENRKYKIFQSIWEDEKKLKNFRTSLLELRARLINKLASDLNLIHKTNFSLRFWKILIDPWLLYYLEGMYTRWETINKIIKTEKNLNFIYFNNLDCFDAPFDVKEYGFYIRSSDVYNQLIFQRIIDFFVKNKQNENFYLTHSNEKIIEELNFLQENKETNYVNKIYNFFFKKFYRKNKFFLDLNSIGFNFLFLNLKLKQIPFKDTDFFTNKNYNKLFENRSVSNLEIRKKIIFNATKENSFENFLSDNISNDIPKSLIEDFFTILKFVESIPYKPKTIVSDSSHYHDTIFKFWVANCVKNESKLLTSIHGGSLGTISTNHYYEEDISNAVIRWHKPTMKHCVQLPALPLINHATRIKQEKRKYLLTIGFEVPHYPFHIFISPISGQSLYQIEHLSSFYENLNIKIKNNFIFKPYVNKSSGENFWNFEKRLENIFKKKTISNTKKYRNLFNKSKIVICTYPKTAFCEAMISGPTILLYKSNYWKNSEDFKLLNEKLKKAKILFEDPVLAAKHINQVWEDIDGWWESSDAKIARESFLKEVASVGSGALNKWKKFLLNY